MSMFSALRVLALCIVQNADCQHMSSEDSVVMLQNVANTRPSADRAMAENEDSLPHYHHGLTGFHSPATNQVDAGAEVATQLEKTHEASETKFEDANQMEANVEFDAETETEFEATDQVNADAEVETDFEASDQVNSDAEVDNKIEGTNQVKANTEVDAELESEFEATTQVTADAEVETAFDTTDQVESGADVETEFEATNLAVADAEVETASVATNEVSVAAELETKLEPTSHVYHHSVPRMHHGVPHMRNHHGVQRGSHNMVQHNQVETAVEVEAKSQPPSPVHHKLPHVLPHRHYHMPHRMLLATEEATEKRDSHSADSSSETDVGSEDGDAQVVGTIAQVAGIKSDDMTEVPSTEDGAKSKTVDAAVEVSADMQGDGNGQQSRSSSAMIDVSADAEINMADESTES